ncbi:hypothetical protein B4U79_19224, partial [Dinothrombium tinctorium]
MEKAILTLFTTFFLISSIICERTQNAFDYPVCGKYKFEIGERNINGKYFNPWIVSLRINAKFREEQRVNFCFGSIIRKRLILTAASCFPKNTIIVRVYFGSQ